MIVIGDGIGYFYKHGKCAFWSYCYNLDKLVGLVYNLDVSVIKNCVIN